MKDPGVDALAFSLKTMCRHNADGSRMTQAQRARGLGLLAEEPRRYGFRLPDAQSLKPKHVNRLVREWQAAGLEAGTIKNRLAWLRWWAMKVNKPGLIPRESAGLGVATKTTFKGDRANVIALDAWKAVPDPRMQLAIRLQRAFGLRVEESCKFIVSEADKGGFLALRPSWTKGGRFRTVPVVTAGQRALLDEVRRVCGNGSLIPDHLDFIQFRKRLDHASLKAGIANKHSLRHWYAQWRYRTLSGGVLAPAAGGPCHDGLSASERDRLDAVRLAVSAELGHGRLDVTDAYLGNRWQSRGGVK